MHSLLQPMFQPAGIIIQFYGFSNAAKIKTQRSGCFFYKAGMLLQRIQLYMLSFSVNEVLL
jgi:hypothetical protein